ncbi:MAG: adenylate/guanylate cyclase domain-containing protein [Proteobacteria bacterium]|nr:adenylate/guanylate cyclase domain-containing protein [Pseudomonadota bacterium]MCP4917910.1 adenylate/guanylate cyclase domain-containing protein [Pseudomonadota bacterium]
MSGPALSELDALLESRNTAPDRAARETVDARIRARFSRQKAVMITDMSGFSRITQEEGILHFLGLIKRMQGLCAEVLRAEGGHLVKAEADNLYATFDHPDHALAAAIALHDACARDSQGRTVNDTIGVSVGMGWGEVLDIDGEDFFGDQVNLASKLGEDIASGGDTLASAAFVETLKERPGWLWEKHIVRISNIEFAYYAGAPTR